MQQLTVQEPEISGVKNNEARNIGIALIGVLVFGTFAAASIAISRFDGPIASIWIPNALAVAILLRARLTNEIPFFAAIFLSTASVNLVMDFATIPAVLFACANVAEVGIAAGLTRKLCGKDIDMESMIDLCRLILAAGIIAPAVSSVIALGGMMQSGVQIFAAWLTWFITGGLGMIIIVPLALLFANSLSLKERYSGSELGRNAAILIAGIVATALVFNQSSFPLLFIVPPIVLLCAFRLGSLGTAIFVLFVAIIASAFTWAGTGPITLISGPMETRLLLIQAFVAASFLTGLPAAAILAGRQRLTEELANRERQLALLADNITDAVLRYDSSGICTYASASVTDVLGEPAESFIGNRASSRMHPDAREKISGAESRLLNGESEKERFTYRRFLDSEDGNPVYIEAECAIANNTQNGEPRGIVVSARDVTERVELELQLIRARRHAENAARAKSEFLANMSHEIRTPMNGVLGFAELMMQSDLNEEQQRHAELIVQSGRSMMLLLNDILDLSKIEAGQINIDSRPIDLQDLIEECADLHRASAEKKNIVLTVDGEEDHPWVHTDGLRLRQIIHNLVGNAVKFTETGEIKVSYSTQGEQITVAVKDTGIGISADRLDRIFNPFEQGENDTARRYGGTGLGLSISRQLAELLGGFLDASSSPGIGTCFTLTLPLVEVSHGMFAEDEPDLTEPELLPQAARILLAEDHDINRLLVTSMLERCNQKVSIAHDGNEAIEMILDSYLKEEPYDLVLMDVQMPGCDGYAATRAIRAEGIRADVLPIIALTANAFPEDIAAARDAGMQAHLSKPLSFSQLVPALQRWLPTKIVEEEGQLFTEPRTDTEGHANVHEFDATAGKAAHSPALFERWQERRSEAIEAVDAAVREGRLTGIEGDELARLVHKLAGTAGMFGEEELGDRAAAFERALRSEVDAEIRVQLAMDLLKAA